MTAVPVRLRRLPHHDPALPPPVYATEGAAGADLTACLPDRGAVILGPGERKVIPTGLALELPEGWEGQVRPRSGLALRLGVTVANAPGTIDSDYRGELGVLLVNLGAEPAEIRHGDRVAQLVLAPVARAEWLEAEDLAPSARGAGGFGSTGVRTTGE